MRTSLVIRIIFAEAAFIFGGENDNTTLTFQSLLVPTAPCKWSGKRNQCCPYKKPFEEERALISAQVVSRDFFCATPPPPLSFLPSGVALRTVLKAVLSSHSSSHSLPERRSAVEHQPPVLPSSPSLSVPRARAARLPPLALRRSSLSTFSRAGAPHWVTSLGTHAPNTRTHGHALRRSLLQYPTRRSGFSSGIPSASSPGDGRSSSRVSEHSERLNGLVGWGMLLEVCCCTLFSPLCRNRLLTARRQRI